MAQKIVRAELSCPSVPISPSTNCSACHFWFWVSEKPYRRRSFLSKSRGHHIEFESSKSRTRYFCILKFSEFPHRLRSGRVDLKLQASQICLFFLWFLQLTKQCAKDAVVLECHFLSLGFFRSSQSQVLMVFIGY